MNTAAAPTRNARGVVRITLIVSACAFLFGFAMIPLYRIACEQVLGIKLEDGPVTGRAVAAASVDTSRSVRIQFLAQGAQAGFLDLGSVREREGVEAERLVVARAILKRAASLQGPEDMDAR